MAWANRTVKCTVCDGTGSYKAMECCQVCGGAGETTTKRLEAASPKLTVACSPDSAGYCTDKCMHTNLKHRLTAAQREWLRTVAKHTPGRRSEACFLARMLRPPCDCSRPDRQGNAGDGDDSVAASALHHHPSRTTGGV